MTNPLSKFEQNPSVSPSLTPLPDKTKAVSHQLGQPKVTIGQHRDSGAIQQQQSKMEMPETSKPLSTIKTQPRPKPLPPKKVKIENFQKGIATAREEKLQMALKGQSKALNELQYQVQKMSPESPAFKSSNHIAKMLQDGLAETRSEPKKLGAKPSRPQSPVPSRTSSELAKARQDWKDYTSKTPTRKERIEKQLENARENLKKIDNQLAGMRSGKIPLPNTNEELAALAKEQRGLAQNVRNAEANLAKIKNSESDRTQTQEANLSQGEDALNTMTDDEFAALLEEQQAQLSEELKANSRNETQGQEMNITQMTDADFEELLDKEFGPSPSQQSKEFDEIFESVEKLGNLFRNSLNDSK